MNNFYKTLAKSCKTFFRNFKSVIIIILLDIAFFVCSALVYTGVWDKIMFNVNAVLQIMEISMEDFAQVQTEAQLSALAAKYDSFMVYYRNIGYYLGMLFVSLLVLWCVFHGINWFLTNDMAGKTKEKFLKYIGKFSLLTVLWWALFLLIISLGMKLSMQASMAAAPLVGANAGRILTWVLLFILFYVAYTSYVLTPKYKLKQLFRELFRTAYSEYKTLVPVYLFTAAVLVLEYYFFIRTMSLGGVAAGIFAVMIIFPTVAWSRFYATTSLEK
jgi:hypothetical protein